MEKNNKLIAEFWGMELGDDKTMYYDDAENLHPPTPINELKFHSCWSWLMPVVKKINLLDDYRYTVYIASMDTKIVDNISGNVIVEVDCKHSIDELRQSLYEAVVEFIKKQTK